MAIDIFEATKILDDLKDDDIDFLLAARQGVALHDAEDVHLKTMREKNLIDILPFDHPRASNAILGVVPNENGVKVLNVIDDRRRAEDNLAIYEDPTSTITTESVENAQSLSKDEAPGEGIPADDPRNIDPDANGEKNADQQAKFESGNKKAKAKKDD